MYLARQIDVAAYKKAKALEFGKLGFVLKDIDVVSEGLQTVYRANLKRQRVDLVQEEGVNVQALPLALRRQEEENKDDGPGLGFGGMEEDDNEVSEILPGSNRTLIPSDQLKSHVTFSTLKLASYPPIVADFWRTSDVFNTHQSEFQRVTRVRQANRIKDLTKWYANLSLAVGKAFVSGSGDVLVPVGLAISVTGSFWNLYCATLPYLQKFLPAAAANIGKREIPMMDQSVELKDTLAQILKICSQRAVQEIAICLHTSDVNRKGLSGSLKGLGPNELDVERMESIPLTESPSLSERLGSLNLEKEQVQSDLNEILGWTLEYANDNGILLYETLAAVKQLLEKLKKGPTRELAKKALEHLDMLSKRATSKVSSARGSRSPS